VIVEVFYSYSRKDQALQEKLENHLAPLRFGGQISTWYDRQLEAGSDWEKGIDNQLDTAHIILLLVSANFLSSEYCYSIELKRALERDERQEACVIPVILEPCDWRHEGIPFSKLTALPNHEKAITEWRNQEAAFANVARGIRVKVESLIQRQAKLEQEEERKRQEELAKQEKQLSKSDAFILQISNASNTLEQLEAFDIFLPALFFIDHIPDAIPGGLMPINMPTLTLAGERITPILPLNHMLLEYFTPEELSRRISFRLIEAESVQVTLDLSLSGIQGKPVNYRISKTYELNKENAQDGVPILEI
jgi:TIR domain